MFYETTVEDYIRVPPKLFHLDTEDAIIKRIKKKYDGFISEDLGIIIDVLKVSDVSEGVVIPGDGAAYYKSKFTLLAFKPEMQEVVMGRIRDIVDFGAFINIGPIDGMIHISQTMNDFVSFSKDKCLEGRDTHRTLKVGDKCKARLIAISFKDINNSKLGLTMRQDFIGKVDWIGEEKKPKKVTNDKPDKKAKKE